MLKSGLYVSHYSSNDVYDSYEITMKVKENNSSYTFELVDFRTKYGATQMEDLFKKSKRIVLRKEKSKHSIRIFSDRDFTLYPYRVGVPYYFVFQEESASCNPELLEVKR